MGPFVVPWLQEHPAEVGTGAWLTVRGIGFILLVLLIGKFVVPHLRKMLAQRTSSVVETQKAAEEARLQLEQQLADYRQRLEHIEEERTREIEAAVKRAEEEAQHLIAEARAEAAAIVRRAHEEMAREREKARARLRVQYAEEILEAARIAAARTLTPERQASLVRAFVRDISRPS